MIYTCTMNPAIDLFTEFECFEPKIVNRSVFEDYQANGKAINISFILKKMGISSVATGFLGGFTGDFIEQELMRQDISAEFVHVPGITRINTFIKAGRSEYKAVNQGPEIAQPYQQELLEKLSHLSENDILFVSGSLPKGIKEAIFLEISRLAHVKKFRLILDISSEKVLDCLADRPYLIKPNEEELASFLGGEVQTDICVLEKMARKLVFQGAEQVIVSVGEQGALYLNQTESFFANAPKGEIVNTACAGDTLLAAFIGKCLLGWSEQEALRYAVAAGSSTAFTAGLSNLDDLDPLLEQIQIKVLRGGNRK